MISMREYDAMWIHGKLTSANNDIYNILEHECYHPWFKKTEIEDIHNAIKILRARIEEHIIIKPTLSGGD